MTNAPDPLNAGDDKAGDDRTVMETGPAPAAADPPWPKPAYAWTVVAILFLANINSYIDRFILNLMIGPMKADLNLSDVQVSLLLGVAFGLFYTIMSLPLGRMSDIFSRRWVMVIGTFFFSCMTLASGMAKNFGQLFAARAGVGIGEASLTPAAYSLIADYFPRERRAQAIAVFTMGAFLGIGSAFIIGGLVVSWVLDTGDVVLPVIGPVFAWQLAFFIVGIPGFLICLLLLFIREPVRRGGEVTRAAVPIREVAGFLVSHAGLFVPLIAGFSFVTLSAYASSSWSAEFFIRTYGLDRAETGLIYGLLVIIFNTGGALVGGWWSDRMTKRGVEDAPMRVTAIAVACSTLPAATAPLMPEAWMAIALLAPAQFFASMPFALVGAAIQQVTPNRLRGQMSAFYLFAINVVGLGLGPVTVALFTDFLFQDEAQLRYSLALVNGLCAPIAALLLWQGLRAYRSARSYA